MAKSAKRRRCGSCVADGLRVCCRRSRRRPKRARSRRGSKQLEDKEQIAQLLIDYGRHLDSRDLAAYASLFATDGEWVGGFGTVKGRAEIKSFMEKSLGTGPNRNNSYHIMSNFVITVKGDTATAWSRWTFITPGASGATIAQAGRYDDTFVRENGVWKFKKRTASNDTAPPGAPTQK